MPEVRRQRVVSAIQGFGDRTRWKSVRLASHQQSKNLQPGRLPKTRQRRERMGHRQALRRGADVTDDGQYIFLHREIPVPERST